MKHSPGRALRFPPVRFAVDVAHVYFSRRVSRASAGLAYFMVLTFFPIIICLSAFLDQLQLNLNGFLDEAAHFLPREVILIFQEYLSYLDGNQSNGMLAVGIFTAILFASAAVRGLMNIMHEIYGRATFRGLRQLAASVLFSLFLQTELLFLAEFLLGQLAETIHLWNNCKRSSIIPLRMDLTGIIHILYSPAGSRRDSPLVVHVVQHNTGSMRIFLF